MSALLTTFLTVSIKFSFKWYIIQFCTSLWEKQVYPLHYVTHVLKVNNLKADKNYLQVIANIDQKKILFPSTSKLIGLWANFFYLLRHGHVISRYQQKIHRDFQIWTCSRTISEHDKVRPGVRWLERVPCLVYFAHTWNSKETANIFVINLN